MCSGRLWNVKLKKSNGKRIEEKIQREREKKKIIFKEKKDFFLGKKYSFRLKPTNIKEVRNDGNEKEMKIDKNLCMIIYSVAKSIYIENNIIK